MLKLFRYLKQSIPAVVMVILLLIIQAVSDLSLPQYTSNIVNIGIEPNHKKRTIDKIPPDVGK